MVKEIVRVSPSDALRAVRRRDNIIFTEVANPEALSSRRIAVFVHYNKTGRVTDMVRCQIRSLLGCDFQIVIITMAPSLQRDDWAFLQDHCAMIVHRRNFGLDFGAWKDAVPAIRRYCSHLQELMLVNDSVLGPICDLKPVIDALRQGGDGFFGLTESWQGGSHLQSYMVMARGSDAVRDLLTFLDRIYISHSKWLVVRFCEIGMSKWMAKKGHRLAALFGYRNLVAEAVRDRETMRRLSGTNYRMQDLESLSPEQTELLFRRFPLNPTHHLWHLLATRFHSPFIKTELIKRNPGNLPDVADWTRIVSDNAPCSLTMIQTHLQSS